MNRELLFPTPIYIFDHNDPSLNEQLERDILNWMQQDAGVKKTNVKGWHSTTNMHMKPEFKRLVQGLFEAQHIIYQEEHYDSEPFLGGMWANVNPPGGMNRAHIHPNSLWAGVYYVKAPKNCGKLIIDDPRSAASLSRPALREENVPERIWREKSYEPVAGRLIMFPAWLTHCVDPNESDDTRISVSFNFLQKSLMI